MARVRDATLHTPFAIGTLGASNNLDAYCLGDGAEFPVTDSWLHLGRKLDR